MRFTLAPHNESDLVDAILAARAEKRTFEITGRGTKRGFGRPVDADCILDVSALSGIVRYEPDELVITAQAATPIHEIESVLADKNQRLGFDPADWGPLFGAEGGNATIGGVLSADACGSARLRFGAARDHLLGYRAVNGFGEAYKAGGHVVKNVTGFDLPKLVCGALGTLAVLSEVTLRLVPRAPQSATLIVRDMLPDAGLALLRRIWASPLDPSGLAYGPAGFPVLDEIGKGAALIRLDGAAEPLADKIAAVRVLIAPREATLLDEGEAIFRQIGNGAAFANRTGDVWRICVPPTAAAACAQASGSPFWYADWAGGVLWLEAGQNDRMHELAAEAGGYATLLRAGAETRRHVNVFPPETEIRAALTRRVKVAFDPLGLFNPGRMFEAV